MGRQEKRGMMCDENFNRLTIKIDMQRGRQFLRNIFLMLASLLLTIIVIGSFGYLYLDSQLPDVDTLRSVQLPVPLRVYTSDGQLLAEFGELRRNPVPFNQIPPMLVKAVLATEDQRFYEHSGVDILGLLRATGELIITGTKSQGGSTITMQVARNFYLTRKKTFSRKLTEIMLALKINRTFTKDQILELYLNKIYLGNRAYGVAAAAQIYYGKPLNQLTLPELAMIAGLPKAPSTINPLVNPIAAKARRDHVLERMYELGYIDQKTYQTAVNTPLTASTHTENIPVHAPYVAEMVRNMMVTSFGQDAYTKGFNVYTTINSQQQEAANNALRNALIDYDHRHGYRGPEQNLGDFNPNDTQNWLAILEQTPTVNGLKPAAVVSENTTSVTALLADGELINIPWEGLAWAKPALKNGWVGATPTDATQIVKIGDLIRVEKTPDGTWQLTQVPQIEGAFVSLNPNNGAITSLVGGFDYQRSKFNRVIQSERQPGSGFKPFIYAAALARGYTLASLFNDAPIVFAIPGQAELWRPQNDDHTFEGPTRLRVALAKSRNVISVRLLQAIGVPYALRYLARFGFDPKLLPRNLSLALGTGEVTPLELVRGYAVFANGGYRVTPFVIDHIVDSHRQLIYQSQPKVACTSCITEQPGTPEPTTINGNDVAPEAIPHSIAFLITSALQDVIRYGTATAAKVLGRADLAGKTGTTSDYIDTWFSGFNSNLVATAWVGFDQPISIHEYGAKAALPMWISFMRVALAGQPESTMPQPPDIITARINPNTGYRQLTGIPEFFRSNDVPAADTSADSTASSATDDETTAPNNNPPATGATDLNAPTSPPPIDDQANTSSNQDNDGQPLF